MYMLNNLMTHTFLFAFFHFPMVKFNELVQGILDQQIIEQL